MKKIFFMDSHGGVWVECEAHDPKACAFGRWCAKPVSPEDVTDEVWVNWADPVQGYAITLQEYRAKYLNKEDSPEPTSTPHQKWGFEEE